MPAVIKGLSRPRRTTICLQVCALAADPATHARTAIRTCRWAMETAELTDMRPANVCRRSLVSRAESAFGAVYARKTTSARLPSMRAGHHLTTTREPRTAGGRGLSGSACGRDSGGQWPRTAASRTSASPQKSHKSGSRADVPTRYPRTKRHFPAYADTSVRIFLDSVTRLCAGQQADWTQAGRQGPHR